MKKILSKFLVLLMALLMIFTSFSVTTNAAEAGTLPSNAITLTSGEWYTKYWTNSNYDLNCYNKITVPSRGYITFVAQKPFDDEGEVCSYDLTLYDPNGKVIWAADTEAQLESFNEYYTYKIGLAAGTYYMNIDPSFYVYRDSAPIETKHKYTYTKASNWEIESNNNMSDATELALNKMYYGVFTDESYDTSYQDYYKVYWTKGEKYTVSIGNYNELDKGTTIIALHNPAGDSQSLYDGVDKDNSRNYNFQAAYTGWYYLRIYNDGNDAGVEYTVKVIKTSKDKIPASKVSSSLSYTKYAYNGTVRKPSVTVTYSGKKLKEGTDYTLSYASGRKSIGKYAVTITFKGNYTGTKKLYFTIIPKKITNLKANAQTTKNITLKWDKVSGNVKYKIYKYSSSSKAYEYIGYSSTNTYKVSGLKPGTTHKFKVRAFKKVNDETINGGYSNTLATATKTSTPSIKTISSPSKGKVKLTWNNVNGETKYQVYCSTKKSSGYKLSATVSADTTSKTLSKLTSKKTYYVKIRTYKVVDGKKIYGAFSSIKTIKVK